MRAPLHTTFGAFRFQASQIVFCNISDLQQFIFRVQLLEDLQSLFLEKIVSFLNKFFRVVSSYALEPTERSSLVGFTEWDIEMNRTHTVSNLYNSVLFTEYLYLTWQSIQTESHTSLSKRTSSLIDWGNPWIRNGRPRALNLETLVLR
ncbi:hypothetical protein RvY_03454, partial [Ramazzottius varieornatus]